LSFDVCDESVAVVAAAVVVAVVVAVAVDLWGDRPNCDHDARKYHEEP
jgi:hypothetical protein